MITKNLGYGSGQDKGGLDTKLIASEIQDTITNRIRGLFETHGKNAPDIIRNYKEPFEYVQIGLKLPPIMGGEVYANINVERLVDDKNGNIQAYAILPGKDGENKMTINQIADGIVDSYNLEVRRNLISL